MKQKSVLYSIISISALGIVAKVLGLFREGVIAAYFGTSAQMDVFGLLTGYVTTIITILASSLAVSYSPYYIRNLQQRGEHYASQHFSHILNQFILVSAIGYFLLFTLSPIVADYICNNSTELEYDIVLLYTKIVFATLITGGMTRLFVSALNGLRKYGWMQITQIIYSVLAIVLVALLGTQFGIDVLIVAFVANSIIQIGILWRVYFQHERKYEIRPCFRDSETVDTWKAIIPIFFGTETYMLGLAIDRTIGIDLGVVGAVAALNYAGILYGLINMVVTSPINTVFCTEMYRNYYKTEDRKVLFHDLAKIINHQAFILIPLGAFLFVATEDFITLVLRRGAFDNQSVTMTASAFCFYALASPFYCFRGLLSGVHIAMHDRTTPMWSGIIFLVVNVSMSFLLSRFMGIKGITLGAFFAMLLSFIYQYLTIKKKHEYNGKFFSSTMIKIVSATLLATVSVYLFQRVNLHLTIYLSLPLYLCIFVSLYAGILYMTKCDELCLVTTKLFEKFKR